MIQLTYYYSACVGIRTPDVSILCDPWFTDGIYDGSWYQYPPPQRPLETIGAHDFVYVSHIHPDHYDARFLRSYLREHPGTRVIIGDYAVNFLSRKMTADGIPHEAVGDLDAGETSLHVVLNDPVERGRIDSALVVRRRNHSIANLNDNDFSAHQIQAIRERCGFPTIALLGYTGAGPYPQTYYDDPATLLDRAARKKRVFLERYDRMRAALEPRLSVPFAGKYLLGGHLHALNPYRGVADAVEVLERDPDAVVLADGGHASVDTDSLTPTATRSERYAPEELRDYAARLADLPMDYERWMSLPLDAVPLARLLPRAYRTARRRSQVEHDHHLCIRVGERWFVANTNREVDECGFEDGVDHLEPRSEIRIDHRYLFGLLTGVFHWNNAEVGSQFQTRRFPDEFDRGVQGFLNFLHV